jgi:hypothetical protein
MQSLKIQDNWVLVELAEAEYRVPEINARIDGQRQLIEELASGGHDITSATIVLDSLFISLFLCVQDRHRLRSILNVNGANGASGAEVRAA